MSRYIDMHCDTLAEGLVRNKRTITNLDGTMVDIERLKNSEASAQFFAMFLPQRNEPSWFGLETMPPLSELMQQMYELFMSTLRINQDCMAFAGNYEQLIENEKTNHLSAFLTIENGAVAEGKMENLKKFYDMGVRLITLTWNDANCFGQNHSTDPLLMQTGLTPWGKEAIEVMNDLGIVVDVSHLSDGGFWDVARISKKPFVASHSNCRELASATRNLTDDMIRALANKGGVAGINFEPSFLNTDPEDKYSSIARICDHIEHFIKVGGIECVGIGTDFDGIRGEFEINDCSKMFMLFDELSKRGLSQDAIDKIQFSNVARVIKESMK